MKLETVFLSVLVTTSCVNGLTVDDFFESDATEMTQTESNDYDLAIEITNFIGIQKPNTFTAIRTYGLSGALDFFSLIHSGLALFYFLYDTGAGATTGSSVLQFTTDASLLNRAVEDITSVINIEAKPTHLIILTGTDIRKIGVATGMGATYQVVVATNGEYTYAIIQIVSVVQGVSYLTSIYDTNFVVVKNFPYTDNVQNAPNDSNSGVAGKYIVDLNHPHPPPYCPSCTDRIQSFACQVLRLHNSTNVPRPCQ